MPLVRYQSPDAPEFLVFDEVRFRVEHGVFYFQAAPIVRRISVILEAQSHWDLVVMKLIPENRRLTACRDWLLTISGSEEDIIVPELPHEPALDLVANHLIGEGDFARVDCLVCLQPYSPHDLVMEPWSFEEEGTTLRGRKALCPAGHTIHALRDSVEALDLEADD